MFRALEESQPNDLAGGPAGHQYCFARVWLERKGLKALLRQGSSRVQDKSGNSGTPMFPLSCILCFLGNHCSAPKPLIVILIVSCLVQSFV